MKIVKPLFWRNTLRKMRGDKRTNPLLPLGFSFKKRCGNFDRGTPWAKCPQHSLAGSSLCLRASSEAGGESFFELRRII
jgi:hypothetical protein